VEVSGGGAVSVATAGPAELRATGSGGAPISIHELVPLKFNDPSGVLPKGVAFSSLAPYGVAQPLFSCDGTFLAIKVSERTIAVSFGC
jgi:hypothetical protein